MYNSLGVVVRDKGHTNLDKRVDTRKIIMELSTSHAWTRWGLFITNTCNQKYRPCLAYLCDWKASEEWTEKVSEYESISSFGKQAIKSATEEVTAPHIRSCWNAVRYMFLRHTKNHFVILKPVCAMFDQDLYKEDDGSL